MNGNSEVSADPVTDDQIRAAIYAADRSAKTTGRRGFTILEVAGTLSKNTVGIRARMVGQVHSTVTGMLLDTGLGLVHQTVTLDYYAFDEVTA